MGSLPDSLTFHRLILIMIGLFIVIAMLLIFILWINSIKKRLRESEAKYRSLFYNSKSVMLLIESDTGRVADANKEAENFYGWSASELKEKSVRSFNILSEEEVNKELRRAAEAESKHFNFRHRLKDGSIRDVEVFTGPVNVQNDTYLYSIVHDVTEKLEYYRKIESSKIKVEKALRVKNDFLANISHELRTPLSGTIGVLNLLKSESLDEQQMQWLEMALDAVGTLSRMIDELLLNTQLETGRLSVKNEWFDIMKMLVLEEGFLRRRFQKKGLRFRMKHSYSSKEFRGDRVLLLQILTNLLTNSSKYSDEGEITLELTEDGDCLRLKVSDQGCGIPDTELNTIFDPFVRIDDVRNRNVEGLGLGLAIVNKIVKSMDGDIDIKSSVGEGTEINISIPGAFR